MTLTAARDRLRTLIDVLVDSLENPARGGRAGPPRVPEPVPLIRDRNVWDTAFVDALCDPPQTFTFGGMVAHVLTWSAHRRLMITGALLNLGADIGSNRPARVERRAA
jgi:hypothetical protein